MNEKILKLVGATIRELRKEKGMSQEELGERADRHFSYIGKLERGESNITLINLEIIAKALGVGIHQFFTFSHNEERLSEKEKHINDIASLLRNNELDKVKKAKNIVAELLR